jgi:malate dehydrogenase (oxaloacetate-decarboxylating)
MDYMTESLKKHEQWQGKFEVVSRVSLETRENLSLAYTPGVAKPCLEIEKDVNLSYVYTRRANLVAVVTDGTAVLGLGDIGAEAAMPVMEGKCVLFKAFGDVDAIPLCIRSKDVDEIVNTVRLLAGSFGGINLEDISAPRCFEIEQRLKECCDIPVFHDDQHGTAIVVLAAITNSLRITKRDIGQIKLVINGTGAAGTAVADLLAKSGLKSLIMCDKDGVVESALASQGRFPAAGEGVWGGAPLEVAMRGADVFIGLSAANCVTVDMVRSMNKDPILFPMANPVPEIMPDLAKSAGVAIVGTGRSDFPNQINNVLAFPGIFRGTLDVRASDINDDMKIAAA